MIKAPIIVTIIALSACLCRPGMTQPPAPAAPEWKEAQIAGTKGYIMPDDLARKMGYQRREIPPEKNAATYYMEAAEKWVNFPDDPAPFIKDPWDAKKFPAEAEWVRKNAAAFDLIRQGAQQDQCQFPILMQKPGDTMLLGRLLPYLAKTRELARGIAIRGQMLQGEGKPGEALKEYLVILLLGSHMGQEDTLIGGLVAVVADNLGLAAIQRCVARENLGEQQLRDLVASLRSAEPVWPNAVAGLRGEQIAGMNAADLLLTGQVTFQAEQRTAEDALHRFLQGRAWRVIMPDRTIKRDLENSYKQMLADAQRPAWTANPNEGRAAKPVKPWNVPAQWLVPALSRANENYVSSRATLYGVTQAAALKWYKVKNGKYPAALPILVPEYLPELPVDPFTGNPFVYVGMGDEFVLYSLGPDRLDNGGLPREEAEGGQYDIVFSSQAR